LHFTYISNANIFVHGKNNFAEIFKNLTRYIKIILLNYQNYYVGRSSIINNAKNFDTLASV